MKNGDFVVIYLLAVLILFPIAGKAQAKEDLSPYYNWFDTTIGIENQEIHYGAVYVEKHRAKSKKSKFFPSPNFTSGEVVIDNLPYYSLNLKYNVYEDELLMKVANKLGGGILQLYKDKIDSFSIGEHKFTKIDSLKAGNKKIDAGFYEILLEKPAFTLLKKHRKLLIEKLGENLVFYEFKELSPEFVIHYTNGYHLLKKMGHVKALFPEHTLQLNSFLETQLNVRFENQLISVFTYMDTLLTSKKDEAMNQ
ncbi:hypothetical protein [Ulvibacterium sp.]|uniref:hypothetical protein n=1 Tax=Ulvibacterium sp. TaxID=2665914 RepID=UPI003BA90B0E